MVSVWVVRQLAGDWWMGEGGRGGLQWAGVVGVCMLWTLKRVSVTAAARRRSGFLATAVPYSTWM